MGSLKTANRANRSFRLEGEIEGTREGSHSTQCSGMYFSWSRLLTIGLTPSTQYELDDTLFYGKVQFFFQATIHDAMQTLVLVSNYSPPDLALFRQSHKTLWTCHYRGADDLRVINVKTIHLVVVMVLFPFNQEKFFVGKEIGLDVATLGGIEEEDLA